MLLHVKLDTFVERKRIGLLGLVREHVAHRISAGGTGARPAPIGSARKPLADVMSCECGFWLATGESSRERANSRPPVGGKTPTKADLRVLAAGNLGTGERQLENTGVRLSPSKRARSSSAESNSCPENHC